MDRKLEDLKLRPALVWELSARGYQTLNEMTHLSDQELLRIPGMGSTSFRRIAKALGREPFSSLSKKRE